MCLHCAHNLFYTMEEEGLIDCENQVHVCCLHYVFLSRIDNSLQVFKEAWNQHLLSSEFTMPVMDQGESNTENIPEVWHF